MFEKFTDRARRVVSMAKQAAKTGGGEALAVHLLGGLVRDGYGVGGRALAETGVTRERVRVELPCHDGLTVTGRKPCSVTADAAFRFAEAVAFEWGHGYVGTEHLAVGVERAGGLFRFGVQPGAVEAEVKFLLGDLINQPEVTAMTDADIKVYDVVYHRSQAGEGRLSMVVIRVERPKGEAVNEKPGDALVWAKWLTADGEVKANQFLAGELAKK